MDPDFDFTQALYFSNRLDKRKCAPRLLLSHLSAVCLVPSVSLGHKLLNFYKRMAEPAS